MPSAVEMRQSPADDALVVTLGELRPWKDDVATSAALRAWVDTRGWAVEDVQGVADELVKLGVYESQLDSETIAGTTACMLVNVTKGRKPTDYGMDSIVGISADARRGRRRRHGARATMARLDSAQYGFTLHQLMLHGSTKQAARRWIQRNPGVWPACAVSRTSLEPPKPAPGVIVEPTRGIVAWRLMRRRCRTRQEFLGRHFAGAWPTPQP